MKLKLLPSLNKTLKWQDCKRTFYDSHTDGTSQTTVNLAQRKYPTNQKEYVHERRAWDIRHYRTSFLPLTQDMFESKIRLMGSKVVPPSPIASWQSASYITYQMNCVTDRVIYQCAVSGLRWTISPVITSSKAIFWQSQSARKLVRDEMMLCSVWCSWQ